MGERAQNGCPAGETCSPITPEGLSFGGAPMGDDLFGLDNELYPTAVGGIQRVTLYDAATGRDLTAPYVATTDVSGVTATAGDGNQMTISASAAGSGRLRIAASDGTLMDRIAIDAMPIASTGLSWPWLGDFIGGRRPIKLWTGTRQNLVVALRAADGRRVVDQAMAIRLTGAGEDFGTYGWDSLGVRRVPVGSTSFEVTAGGAVHAVAIDVVDALDAVEAAAPAPTDIRAGDSVTACFVARSGDAHVLGAPWQFASSGPAELMTNELDGVMDNCAQVRTTAAGTVTVSANVGALAATVTIAVEPRNRRTARTLTPVDLDAAPAPVLGERAR